MNMTLIASLISAGVAGLAGWGAAWTIQGRTIDSLRIEAKDAIIIQQRATRAAIERATSNVREAQTSAANRIAVLNRELAAVGSERDRLRDTSTIAVRTATDSPAACASIVAAYRDIQLEGSSFIQTLATDVDQCLSNLQLMHEAWPKN